MSRNQFAPVADRQYLKEQLKGRLLKKYMTQPNSRVVSAIDDMVDKACAAGRLDPAGLAALERQARDFSVDQAHSVTGNPHKSIVQTKFEMADEWSTLLERQRQRDVSRIDRERDKAAELKRWMKQTLDEEVAIKNERLARDLIEKKRMDQQIIDRDAEDNRVEAEKKKAELAKSKRIAKERADQMRDVQRARLRVKRENRIDERNTLLEVKKALEEERRQQHEKVLEEKKRMAVTLAENEQHKADMAVKKQQAMEEEVTFAKQYAEMLDEQDRSRAAQMQKLKDKMTSKQKAYEATTGNAIAEKEAHDEAVAKAHQEEAMRKEKEAVEAKLEKARRDKLEMVATLDAQVAHVKAQKREEKRQDKLYRDYCAAEAESAARLEDEKQRKRQNEIDVCARALEEQMRMKAATMGKSKKAMSQFERMVNKTISNRQIDCG